MWFAVKMVYRHHNGIPALDEEEYAVRKSMGQRHPDHVGAQRKLERRFAHAIKYPVDFLLEFLTEAIALFFVLDHSFQDV